MFKKMLVAFFKLLGILDPKVRMKRFVWWINSENKGECFFQSQATKNTEVII